MSTISRIELAERAYSNVLRRVEREERKAVRLLIGVALMAIGPVGIFATVNGDPSPVWNAGGREIDLILLSFGAFMLFTGMGFAASLIGLGPRYNGAASAFSRAKDMWASGTSMVEPHEIASHTPPPWEAQWAASNSAVEEALAANLVRDSHLISRGARNIVIWSNIAATLFFMSVSPLLFFLAFVLNDDPNTAFWFGVIGSSALVMVFGAAYGIEPDGARDIVLSRWRRKGWAEGRETIIPAGLMVIGCGALIVAILGLTFGW
jgi:hypothetical protein